MGNRWRASPLLKLLILLLSGTHVMTEAPVVGSQIVTPEQLRGEGCQQGARAELQRYAADRSADKIQLPILNQATQMCIQDHICGKHMVQAVTFSRTAQAAKLRVCFYPHHIVTPITPTTRGEHVRVDLPEHCGHLLQVGHRNS